MKIIFILLTFSLLYAHQMRENYLKINYSQKTQKLSLELEVETRLLENETLIDDNHNGIISYKELRNHKNLLFKYTQEHWKFFNKDKVLSLKNALLVFHRYQDQTYLQINKSFSNIILDDVTLQYDMFFEKEKNHKLLIHLDENRGDYILDNTNRIYHLSSYPISLSQRLVLFTKNGIYHILDGFDHLLFVLMILIPSIILLKTQKKPHKIRITFLSVLKIITTFSVAHSITLFLSAFDIYRPNTQFIESGIALSIFIVAFMNLFRMYQHVNKKIVFVFGLLHGFGFANVLEISGVETISAFITALFGFNLGVELGQIAVISLYLPLLYFSTKTKYFMRIIEFLSFLTLLVSAYWFLQRVDLLI